MRFLYLHKSQKKKANPSIYSIDQRRGEIAVSLHRHKPWNSFAKSGFRPARSLLGYFKIDANSVQEDYGKFSVDGLDHRRNFLLIKTSGARGTAASAPLAWTNLRVSDRPFWYGRVARSMPQDLGAKRGHRSRDGSASRASRVRHHPIITLSVRVACKRANVSVTVANADSAELLTAFLHAPIGGEEHRLLVWETRIAPRVQEERRAIRRDWVRPPTRPGGCTHGKAAVRVVPHTLDFAALRGAKANRGSSGSRDRDAVWFMFDPESGIQRKNVEGLIRAFCSAFRKDDDCYLVLKVNAGPRDRWNTNGSSKNRQRSGVVPRDGSHAQPNLRFHGITRRVRLASPVRRLRTHMCRSHGMGVPVVASRTRATWISCVTTIPCSSNECHRDRTSVRPYLRARGGRARLRRGVVGTRSLLDKAKRLAIGSAARNLWNRC